MIGPRKKISKHKRRQRHSTWQRLNLKRLSNQFHLSTCANCGVKKLSHRVCEECGFYKGKQVITIKSKSSDKVMEA